MAQKSCIPNSTPVSPRRHSPPQSLNGPFSNTPPKNKAIKPSNVPFEENLMESNQVSELINMNALTQMAQSTKASLKGSGGNENFQELKIEMKNMLMRMAYREKLSYMELLTNQGRALSKKYGYFYVTCAMIVYYPIETRKLSLWVHPNLDKTEPVHPILNGTQSEKEEGFIKSLKNVLHELFPTIPLGPVNDYQGLIAQIQELQNNIKHRIQNSHSRSNASHKKKKALKQNQPQNLTSAGKKKSPKEISSIDENALEESFTSMEKNLLDILGDGEFTMYGYNSSLDTTRNNILNDVAEEFQNILN